MVIIKESKRDDLLLPYLELLRSRGIEMSLGQFKTTMLGILSAKGGIKNLSLASNYYLAGATKYYFNGDLTFNKDLCVFKDDKMANDQWNEEVCKRLDALILILRNAYIDTVGEKFEIEEDFGTLSLPKLLRKYNKKINDALGIVTKKEKEDTPAAEPDRRVGNGYRYEIIYSHDQSAQYERYTAPGSWCITYSNTTQYFNYYSRSYDVHYVFFLKDGFENVERKMGAGFTRQKPHDEYGNSMIAYLQYNNRYTAPIITSRWNHGSNADGTAGIEADKAYTLDEFKAITGVSDEDLQRIWNEWAENKGKKKTRTVDDEALKKNAEKKEAIRKMKMAQMRLNGGESPLNVFNAIQKISGPDNISSRPILADDESTRSDFLTLFKKGVVQAVLKKERDADNISGNYVVVVDRGKILFETVMHRLEYDRWHYAAKSENEYHSRGGDGEEVPFLKNLIIINVKNGILLYDTRRRSYVNVDGTIKFKHISDSWYTNDVPLFFTVAMTSSQMALISTANNQPLRLPNGAFWFDSFSTMKKRFPGWNRRNLRFPYVYKSDGMIDILYDPSSQENFLYNISRRDFVNKAIFEDLKSEEGSTVRLLQGSSRPGYYCMYSEKHTGRTEKKCGYFNIQTNERLTLEGLDTFSNLEEAESTTFNSTSKRYETYSINGYVVGLTRETKEGLIQKGYEFDNGDAINNILYDADKKAFVTYAGNKVATFDTYSVFEGYFKGVTYISYSDKKGFFYDSKRKGIVLNQSRWPDDIHFKNSEKYYASFFEIANKNGEQIIIEPDKLPIDDSMSRQVEPEPTPQASPAFSISESEIKGMVTEAIRKLTTPNYGKQR